LDPSSEESNESVSEVTPKLPSLPDGSDKTVLCAGGRGELDNAAVAMLAQMLTAQGATSRTIDHLALDPSRIKSLDLSDADAMVIGFLNAQSVIRARYIVRRLKRARNSLRVGVVFWRPADDALSDLKLSATIGCDFIARTMRDAVAGALSDEKPVEPKSTPGKVTSRKPKSRRVARQIA